MPADDRERDWQIGGVHRKVDAMERMRGVTRYTDDLKLPGMLHAKILRSPHAHAKILSIDVSAAVEMPGVFAVVTGQDFKIPYGIIPWTPDENALAVTKVCHVGDGVAAVAAVDEDTANAALAAIKVDYEVLRAFYDPEEALALLECAELDVEFDTNVPDDEDEAEADDDTAADDVTSPRGDAPAEGEDG